MFLGRLRSSAEWDLLSPILGGYATSRSVLCARRFAILIGCWQVSAFVTRRKGDGFCECGFARARTAEDEVQPHACLPIV